MQIKAAVASSEFADSEDGLLEGNGNVRDLGSSLLLIMRVPSIEPLDRGRSVVFVGTLLMAP